jgi:hypothetical protein
VPPRPSSPAPAGGCRRVNPHSIDDGGGVVSSCGGTSPNTSGEDVKDCEPGRQPQELEVVLPWCIVAWVTFTGRYAVLGERTAAWSCGGGANARPYIDDMVAASSRRAQSRDGHLVLASGGVGRLLSYFLGLQAAGGRDHGGRPEGS